jgi:hypothetical protein
MLLRFILYYIINIGLGIINYITLASEELPQQPPQQTEEELAKNNDDNRRPYYTYNSYELCSEILSDIQDLKNKSSNANDFMGILHLWNDLKYGTDIMLMEMKLELLQHFLEVGK